MAYPEGYVATTWDKVKNGELVYIIEDGRDKPYGPYTVVDTTKHMVEDPKALYDRQFPILPHETIGIPDVAVKQLVAGGTFTVPGGTVPAGGPTVTPSTMAIAAKLYDELFEAFTLQLASKSLSITQTTRQTMEHDARVRRETFIKSLSDALKR